MKIYKKKIYRVVFWISLLALLAVSSFPANNLNQTINNPDQTIRLDYVLHFTAYLLLGVLAFIAYKPSYKLLLLVVLFALIEEVHQYWIPFRTLNPYDFLFDVAGLIASYAAIKFYTHFRNKN